jgi:hypothetical protein
MSEVNLTALRAKYVADFREQADMLDEERKNLLAFPTQLDWVVVMPGNIGVRFEMADGMLINPKPTTALKATRMNQEFALITARKTFNGSGHYAEPMKVTTLLERQVTGLRKSANDVEGLPPITE